MTIKTITIRQFICDALTHDQQAKILANGTHYYLYRNLADGTERLVCQDCRKLMGEGDLLSLIGIGFGKNVVAQDEPKLFSKYPIAGDASAG